MAEEALKKLQRELRCSICLDTYTDAKQLMCLHINCRKCLEPLVLQDPLSDQLFLTCPTCRQITLIPDIGVAGLKSAFHINNLLEIYKKLSAPDLKSKCKVYSCLVHQGKELELYCETCDELLCFRCIMKSGAHHNHEYEELTVVFERYKEEIKSMTGPIENQEKKIREELTRLCRCRSDISSKSTALEDSIHASFDRLREVLSFRETELIGKLHQMTLSKMTDITAQTNKVEMSLAEVSSHLHFMRESIRAVDIKYVLKMKPYIMMRAKEMSAPFRPDMESNIKADIAFEDSKEAAMAETLCKTYGQIIIPGIPDPSCCYLVGKGKEVAVVGERSTIVLQAVNFNGKPCVEPIKSLQCDLKSEISGVVTNCSIKIIGQNQYESSYQPAIKGRHQLHYKVDGQHIRGSPFVVRVTVKTPIENLSTPILTLSELKGPSGVAINQKGEVVVAEKDGHCVSVVPPDGKIRTFGTRGSGRGQFHSPHGVAIDGEGNILISDKDNHRIQKLTSEGHFLTSVGLRGGDGPLEFFYPSGISYNAYNNKIYVVDKANRVQVLNSDLTFSSTFGKPGIGKGEFDSPNDIACDSTGAVYVADTDNNRIQVFTADGQFLRVVDGTDRGRMGWPCGLAVDTSGMNGMLLYVTHFSSNYVSVFDSEGQIVTSFEESDSLFKSKPNGLAVDNSGVVYVCNHADNAIYAF